MIQLNLLLVIEILRWVVLLGEGYLAKRIYHIISRHQQYREDLIRLRLLTESDLPSSERQIISQIRSTRIRDVTSQAIPAWLIMRGQVPSYSKNSWSRLAMGICLGSVFFIVFLITLYMLRPITFRWVLGVLPLLIPLILLPLPYLFHVQPHVALFLLGIAIGVGFLLLLTLGI